MIRGLLFVLLTLLPVPAMAQSLEGSWALRLDGTIIFRFDLERDGEGWRGSWSRPETFASDGDRFGNLRGAETLEASEGREIGAWAELTFPDNRAGAVPDVFRFNLMAANRAELIYAGTGLAPYTLERVADDAVLGPWEEGKVYRRPGLAPPAAPPRAVPRPEPEEEEVQGPPAFEGR
jgi:hypothetical protein